MTAINDKIRERLSAYLDGELGEDDRRAVEILAEKDAEIAAELEALMRADSAAKDAFAALLDDPVPLALARSIETMQPAPEPVPANDPGPPRTSPMLRIAAGLALMLIGGGIGGYLATEFRPQTQPVQMASRGWTDEVADYHRIYAAESRHLVEVAATEQDHIESWLGARTGVPFKVPDLAAEGLEFRGARLLVASGKPVAQLIYTDAGGEVFALCFLSSDQGATEGMTARDAGDLDMLVWRSDTGAFVAIGPDGSPVLPKIAEEARRSV